jgi:hypothetical protein
MTREIMMNDIENTNGKVKDANDLLTCWVKEGVGHEEQVGRVRELLAGARPMAVAAAAWAGEKRGAERDEAVRTAYKVIALMEKQDQAIYRQKLCDALGVGVRDFNNVVKASKEEGKGKDDEQEAVYTLGGVIDGWLVDYCYEAETHEAKLAWRSPSGVVESGKEVTINGERYRAQEPTQLMQMGGIMFAPDVGPLKTTKELIVTIELFLRKWYLLDNKYLYKLVSYYILFTWVFDSFRALPYLRAMGDAGAGKSEFVKRVGMLCYRLMVSSGASTSSSLFRAIQQYQGTLLVDEMDLYGGGDMSNDIIKLLNLGSFWGNLVWRVDEIYRLDGAKEYQTVGFRVYGPKLIAMREPFKDVATESRCITIKCSEHEAAELQAAGIPLFVDDSFYRSAAALRGMLLRWRLEHWQAEIPVDAALVDTEISNRLNQVTMPLLALATDDPELVSEIRYFIRVYHQEMTISRSMTLVARVVEALWKIFTYEDLRTMNVKRTEGEQAEYVLIGDVTRIVNEIIDEMNEEPGEKVELNQEDGEGEGKKKFKDDKNKVKARKVGSIIRTDLQLRVGARIGNGYPVYWDEARMESLGKKFGVDREELRKRAEKGKDQPDEQGKLLF